MPERIAARLHIDQVLTGGAPVALGPAASHRLRDVLRLAPGAALALFNERDGEWLGHITELGRGRAALKIERRLRPPGPEADLWLLFAPIKRARLDWLVEKATELGVAMLRPVWTERTQTERLNLARLRSIAIAAAEQSERLSIPDLPPPERLSQTLADWPAARRLILCDESGAGAPIGEAVAAGGPAPSAALLVGPEGGFAPSELDALGKLPIVSRMSLGPRVLRAETAALAAIAVYQAIAGDWHRNRRH